MSLLDRLLDLERRPLARPYTDEGYDLRGYRQWLEERGFLPLAVSVIHIAGTKGKGSTAAMVEALLHAAGLRTALFTSPHLVHYGERFRFDGRPWTPDEFEAALERFVPLFDDRQVAQIERPHGLRTVFEVLTAMALAEASARAVDVLILEVGLGGRLDCTNVIDAPRVCAITPIGLDHVKILGNTIEQIAAEKAGIIKAGRPVAVFAPVDARQEQARAVIENQAIRLDAPVLDPPSIRILSRDGGGQEIELAPPGEAPIRVHLALRGDHQAQNFALASRIAAEFLVQQGFALSPEHLAAGAERVRWPGRLDVIAGPPALVLDGAHCPLSARALGRSLHHLREIAPPPWTLIWGMQADKDHAGFLGELLSHGPAGGIVTVVCYEVPGGRGAPAGALVEAARARALSAHEAASPQDAAAAAFEDAQSRGGSLLACGTLYTLAPIAARHGELLARGRKIEG